MANLDGLARSYARIHQWLVERRIVSRAQLLFFRKKTRSIMVKSFLRAGRPMAALATLFNRGPFAVPGHSVGT